MAKSYAFRDLGRIGTAVKVLLALGAFLALVALLSSYLQLRLLDQEFVSAADADANDVREGLVAMVQLIVLVPTILLFGMWIHRAHANVRAVGATSLRFTPGWAVGYFFIPVLNVWKPYQAMKDLWRASQDPVRWKAIPAPNLLPVWWMFWLVSNALGQFIFRSSLKAESIEELQSLTKLEIVGYVVDFASCITAYFVVARIGVYQARLGAPADPAVGGTATTLGSTD